MYYTTETNSPFSEQSLLQSRYVTIVLWFHHRDVQPSVGPLVVLLAESEKKQNPREFDAQFLREDREPLRVELEARNNIGHS